MNESGNSRKVWPPAGGDARELECRRCGCRHFIVENKRRVGRMVVCVRCCRYCGKRVTTRGPADPG
jgi:hypothetical protein